MSTDPNTTTTVSLAAWLKAEKARLDEFEQFWIEGAGGADRDAFPARMDEGEWDEQFRCWSGG